MNAQATENMAGKSIEEKPGQDGRYGIISIYIYVSTIDKANTSNWARRADGFPRSQTATAWGSERTADLTRKLNMRPAFAISKTVIMAGHPSGRSVAPIKPVLQMIMVQSADSDVRKSDDCFVIKANPITSINCELFANKEWDSALCFFTVFLR
jgi:hypothetical protein